VIRNGQKSVKTETRVLEGLDEDEVKNIILFILSRVTIVPVRPLAVS